MSNGCAALTARSQNKITKREFTTRKKSYNGITYGFVLTLRGRRYRMRINKIWSRKRQQTHLPEAHTEHHPLCARLLYERLGGTMQSQIEALLLVAEEPLSLLQLSAILDQPIPNVNMAINALISTYKGRGIVVACTAKGFQFAVAEGQTHVANAYRHELKTLSPEAETLLGLVAYMQPVTSEQLLTHREESFDHALETLVTAGLITRPCIGELFWATTPKFLESCGIQSLDDLPLAD